MPNGDYPPLTEQNVRSAHPYLDQRMREYQQRVAELHDQMNAYIAAQEYLGYSAGELRMAVRRLRDAHAAIQENRVKAMEQRDNGTPWRRVSGALLFPKRALVANLQGNE